MKSSTTFLKLFLAALVAVLLGAFTAHGTTYYSVADGNWNATGTWSTTDGGPPGAGPPTSSDAVVINRNHTVTADANNAACASLQLGGTGSSTSGTGTITFVTTGSPALTVSGAVTVGGNGNSGSTGTITFTSGSSLTAGSLTLGNSGTTPAPGTITMTAGGTLSVGGAITVKTVSGNTWAPGTGTGTVNLTANNTLPATILTTFNNLIINGGMTTLGVGLSITGDLTLASGTLDVSTSNFGISIGGNWVNNGGAFTPRSGTVTFTGSSTAINGSAASQTFCNLKVNKTAGQTLSVGGSTTSLTLNGAFTETSGNFTAPAALDVKGNVTLTAGTFTAPGASGSFTVAGDWSNSGTFTPQSGTVTFNGSTTQRIYGSTTFNNLELASTALATVFAYTSINVGGTMTIDANATFAPNDQSYVINSAAAGTLTGSGTITVTRTTSGSADLRNQYKFNSYLLGNLSVIYAGSAPQTVNSSVSPYGALVTSVGGTKTLDGAVIVNGDFNIGTGTVLAAAANDVSVGGNWANGVGSSGFTSASGETVTLNGAGAQNIAATTFNNLTLSGGGNKTMASGIAVNHTLSIAPTGSAKASVANGLSLSVGTLKLGGVVQVSGTWGSSISSAVHKTDSYFDITKSGVLNVAGGAATQILVETSADGTGTLVPAQVVTAGNSIMVYAITRDTHGNFVANAPASWSLPTRTVGVANGDLIASGDTKNATFTGHLTGTAVIEATSGSLTKTDSGTITVSAGAATRLVITGSSSQQAGSGQDLTITAEDGCGNTVTAYTGSRNLVFSGADSSPNPAAAPTVKDSSGTAVAFGTATAITFNSGVATVSGGYNGVMTLYAVESVYISAADPTDSIPASSGSDRLAVTVSPGSMSKFVLSLASPQQNGVAFTGANTLTAEDAYGNTVTSFSASANNVTLAANALLTGTISGLSGGNKLIAAGDFSSGAANLTALGMKYTGNANSGTFTATAATGGYAGSSRSVTITAGAAAVTQVETAADGTGSIKGAGNAASGSSVMVYAIARDASGNFVANATATWSLVNLSGGVVSGDLVPAGDNKSATFTGHVTGSANLQAVAGGFTGQSGLQTVIPGPASAPDSTISANPTSIPADGSSTATITVQARDANNNHLTTGGSTVVISKASGAGTLGGITDHNNGTYTATITSPASADSATFTATLGGVAVGVGSPATVTFTSTKPTPSISGVVNQTNTFGMMTTLTLTGTLASGATYPAGGESISATINGQTVSGSFANDTGAFVIHYADGSLASDSVSGSPYPITYSYAGDSNLGAAEDTSTTLTILPALTGASDAGALDGFTAASIPVAYVTQNGSVITYSNVVQASASGRTCSITVGVPPGTTSLRLKPRFYLSKLFTSDRLTFAGNTGTINLSGVTFLGGDANGDDQVNGTDYAWLRYWWGYSRGLWAGSVGADATRQYDVNGDGSTDANDFPDFDGDGTIGAEDYGILKKGWYHAGDPE